MSTERTESAVGAGRRVALYGGSFDPPHNAHVLAVTWLLCRAHVDAVWLLPTYAHAFGKTLAPFDERVAMLRLAMAHLGPQVAVEPIEATLAQPSYTVQTVDALREREPGARFTWLMGTDSFAERERWHQFERLESMVDFLLVGRDGQPDPEGVEVPVHLPAIASSDVRRRLRAGQPVAHLLPEAVYAHIDQRGLYR
ncbi:MAG: nicotinate (nicotinamide) nucleotide adenylyltransferase [Myxococcota bacterium]